MPAASGYISNDAYAIAGGGLSCPIYVADQRINERRDVDQVWENTLLNRTF